MKETEIVGDQGYGCAVDGESNTTMGWVMGDEMWNGGGFKSEMVAVGLRGMDCVGSGAMDQSCPTGGGAHAARSCDTRTDGEERSQDK